MRRSISTCGTNLSGFLRIHTPTATSSRSGMTRRLGSRVVGEGPSYPASRLLQVLREERQHLLFETLRDPVAVIAFVGLEGVRDRVARHRFDQHLVARDQVILQ